MKKWLVVAGFVGAFTIGAMTSGSFSSFASAISGMNDTSNIEVNENRMTDSSQGSAMMNMMGTSGGMNMMANMNGTDMMNTMSNMVDLMDHLFSEAAKTLGMTTEQLQTELQDGKSLKAISEERGIVKDELATKLEDVIRQDLDKLKKEGILTTEEQEKMLLYMSENIGAMLDSKGMFACSGFNETNGSSF
ncbi:hypothetical protein ACA30_13580 [Virgibacillus soli]|nr:hypothetical protein ACA30_13580 [Virgibacillus soli]